MPRRNRSSLSPLIVVLLLAAAACGPFRRGGPPEAVIIFNNQSIDQANVYAVAGGQQIRIGTVFGGRKDTLKVPSSTTSGGSTLSIVARLLASTRAISSGPLSLYPGDSLEITLPPDEKLLTVLPTRQP